MTETSNVLKQRVPELEMESECKGLEITNNLDFKTNTGVAYGSAEESERTSTSLSQFMH